MASGELGGAQCWVWSWVPSSVTIVSRWVGGKADMRSAKMEQEDGPTERGPIEVGAPKAGHLYLVWDGTGRAWA